jgi:hypothetical protein
VCAFLLGGMGVANTMLMSVFSLALLLSLVLLIL